MLTNCLTLLTKVRSLKICVVEKAFDRFVLPRFYRWWLMGIENRFHHEMLAISDQAREFGYYPAYFLRMVMEQGGLRAAKQLLRGEEMSSGLMRLWDHGRLDVSVEALVLREPWVSLFTDEELTAARQRLEELNYSP